MTKENPNDVIVESGNLSNMPDRVGLVASVLSGLRYDAVGIGETDLRTSGEEFFKKTAENKLTVLDASPEPRKSTLRYLVKSVDGVRVGVISFGFVPDDANVNEYARRKALYAAFKAVREKSDILVVLDQANVVNRDWIERNEKRLGAPDIVIGGGMRQYLAQAEVVGKTYIVPTSMQGKHVGVVDVEFSAGQQPKFTLQKIALEANVVEDEAVKKQVKEFMGKGRPQIVNAEPKPPVVQQAVNPNAKPYYPSALCKTCHVKEYEDWRTTEHASAIATLTSEQRMIPECLKCHSEMFRRLERVTVMPKGEGGVECATCHMGSLPHGLERKNVTAKTKVDPKMCVECHDKQWSPKYEEKSYVAKISHFGAQNVAASPPASPASPAAQPSGRAVRPTPPLPPAPPRPPTVK